MKTCMKNVLIFTGGIAVGSMIGSIKLAEKLMSDEDIRKAIVSAISDKISKWLYD